MKTRCYHQLLSIVLVLALLTQLLPPQVLAASSSTTDSATLLNDTVTESGQPLVTVIGEDETLRTETEKHFRMSDGSYMAVSYGIPVHYQDEVGMWQDIDNTLVSSQNTYSVNNANVATTFSANLNNGVLFSTSYDGTSVAMSLLDTAQSESMVTMGQIATESMSAEQNAQATYDRYVIADVSTETESVLNPTISGKGWTAADVIPEKLQSSVLYKDVFPDVDLLYTTFGYNIKEQIIVNVQQTVYRYDFSLALDGVEAVLNNDGSVSLLNESGEEVYYIPIPFMEDSNGAVSNDVSYSLTSTAGGVILSVEADAGWMNDASRVYPVAIDPTLNVQAGSAQDDIYTSYIAEGAPDTSYGGYQYFYLGYTEWNDMHEYRGFAHFNNIPTIPSGAVVTEAQFGLYMHDYSYVNRTELSVGVYEVTGAKPDTADTYYDWIYNLTWNSMPVYNTSNLIDYAVLSNNAKDQYYYWDLSELVKKWYAEETENRTIAMTMTAGSTSDTNYAQPVFYSWANSNPPMLFVTYRNVLGIEDYYSYATLGAGAAGTVYISDFTGQMTVVKGLVSYSSAINPFAVNLVYNSNYIANNDLASNYPAEEFMDMSIGVGWTLDILQRIDVETLGDSTYLKYRDGDGTVHYFSQNPNDPDDNTFYDEDGLGLSITMGENTSYIMSDSLDNTYTFSYGILSKIEDNNGNQYILNFENQKLASVTQKNNGATTETTVASFAYTNDYLTSVTDAAGRVYTLNYTYDLLTSISLGDTVIAEYSFAGNLLSMMTDSESGYSIAVGYDQQSRISGYAEKDRNGQYGAQVIVTYSDFDKTTYRDYGNDRARGTEDDILTHYLFDNSGRTVNAYSTDADGSIVGASTAIYHDGSEIDKRNNRTLRTASIGIAAEQELLNSGFENTSATYSWNLSGSASVSTGNPRTGRYALKASPPVVTARIMASRTSKTLYAGQTYTLSAYVNTSQMTTISGNGVYLSVTDTAGNSWNSDYFRYKTSETVDDGWMRISVTFTAQTSGTHTVSVNCLGGVGTFYADDLQLEKGNAPANRNLVENGNAQTRSCGWTFGSNGSFSTVAGVYRQNDTLMSLSISGDPLDDAANVYQSVPINRSGVQSYVLSGWAKGNAVPDNVTAVDYAQDVEKAFGLRATVNYTNGTKEYYYAPFNADISEWQFTSLIIGPTDAAKTISTITVSCAYEKNANVAYFDNISLVQEAVQTMDYDADGNLTSAETTGVESNVSTYEDGNLIETVTGTGSAYSYTYDQTYTHRLLSATDGSTTQSLTYDGYGNVTSSTLAANAGSNISMVSTGTYSGNGNRLSSSTDTNGITTSYVYSTAISQMLGQPTKVMASNGTNTYLSYDSYGRTKQTNVANQAYLVYTYSNGDLTSILRHDGSSHSQKYSMSYDTFGNMVGFNVDDLTLMSYEYGAKNGQLTKQTYRNGATVTYTYDTLGRISTANYHDGRVARYSYNGDGQLHSIKETGGDSPATYLYTYDSIGRLIASEKKDASGNSVLRVYQNYNSAGQLVGQSLYVGDDSYTESYTYNTTDGSLNTMVTGTGQTLQLGYDNLRRLTSVGNGLYTRNYSYRNLSSTKTTAQVSQVRYTGLPTELTYGYTYDAVGNIATYSAPGKDPITYTYDALGQLLSAVGDETYTYTYDAVGNILTSNGHTYTYSSDSWEDILVLYDGQAIAYDPSGNPLSYYNGTRWTFTWENGRSLATATDGTTNISYAYDASGLRTAKTVGGVTHNYLYASGQLLRETYGSNTLDFFYDASGYPYALKYNGTAYYYITNLQGDVMYLVDAQGNTVASYEYDPYGNIVSATGSMAEINPLRYRGYYYDTELEMYYLQSRYYDPQIGRFINADIYASTGQGIAGCNMFAYCSNNPINCVDFNGQEKLFLAEYIIFQLCAALTDIMIGVRAAMVSIKVAIKASIIPALCIAAAAVGVTAISYVFYQVHHLMATAHQAIAAVKTQILQKKIKESQLKNYTVYAIARKGTTDVVYVGITKNYSSRQYTHQRKTGARFPTSKYDMIPIATNLSYKQARALEQTLICAYGIDTLCNIINSISPKKWGTFVQEFNQMATLIESYFDSY